MAASVVVNTLVADLRAAQLDQTVASIRESLAAEDLDAYYPVLNALSGEANEKLIASLQRIEAAMDQSAARSDEQLAYYVAQAREIIDLSLMSQEKVVAELRQLAGKPAPTAEQPN